MGTFIKAFIGIITVVVVLFWLGLGWLVFEGAEAVGTVAEQTKAGGLKSIIDALWCGSNGCK